MSVCGVWVYVSVWGVGVCVPLCSYLDRTVVPLVLQGLEMLSKERYVCSCIRGWACGRVDMCMHVCFLCLGVCFRSYLDRPVMPLV